VNYEIALQGGVTLGDLLAPVMAKVRKGAPATR
jgi:hypothetical protein